ncbi:hypothetical protein RCO28_24370 [Streptomyces sp. LHD-70]|uniref:hypothetical protein n=1 Tax=Streptomyces sp. LHD-70 TaxID=3072140 RepID=UPI00280C9022|nr:hypothetical protein [Streptomyces sp. LHD-70]MDQ8705607.1 hypothetical protein [Streptomyces sp. LHD-70]
MMTTKAWLQEAAAKKAKEGSDEQREGGVRRWIYLTDGTPEAAEQAEPYAFPEVAQPPGGAKAYRESRKEGVRSFTLWADRYRQQVLAYVVTKSAAKGQASMYEILGAAGEPLARVMRERALQNGARTRWTVEQMGGPTLVGVKGNAFWWFVWWLILPLQIVMAVAALIGGDGLVARMPYRTKWKLDGQTVLYLKRGSLRAKADWWDPRVTAGLVALLKSYDGFSGKSWDEWGDPPEKAA